MSGGPRFPVQRDSSLPNFALAGRKSFYFESICIRMKPLASRSIKMAQGTETSQTNIDVFVRQVVQQYRTKLLDLTNRNPLINFRHSERSRSHIRVVDELPEKLFNKLSDGKQLSFESLPRSARERDRLRQEILEKYGWKLYRIWSTDWFRNPSLQTKQLLAYLQQLPSEVSRT